MVRIVHPGIRILIFYPSRIQGSKRHRIRNPDPDPQHWQNGSTGKKAHLKSKWNKTSKMPTCRQNSTKNKGMVWGEEEEEACGWPGTTTWELFMGNCASVFVARNTTSDKGWSENVPFREDGLRKCTKRIGKGKNRIKKSKNGKFTKDIETMVLTF